MSLRKRAVSGVKWNATKDAIEKILSLVVFLVAARVLGPEKLGVFTAASALIALTQPFYQLGLTQALIQRKSLEVDHFDTAFWAILGGSAVAAATLFTTAELLANLVKQPILENAIQWLAPLILINSTVSLQDAKLRRELDFRPLAIREMIANSVNAVLTIGLAIAGFGLYSLIVAAWASTIVRAAMIWRLTNWHPRLRFSTRRFGELWTFARAVFPMSVLRIYNLRSPTLFITYYFGAEAVAFFALAERLLRIITELFTQTINSVAFPVFARMQSDIPRLLSIFYTASGTVAMVTIPACFGLALTAPALISVALSDEWLASAPLMQIVILLGASTTISFFNGAALLATGKPQLMLLAVIVRAVVGTMLFTTLHFWGLLGMAVAFVIRGISSEFLQWLLLARNTPGFSRKRYLAPLAHTLLASSAMVLTVLSTTSSIDSVNNPFIFILNATAIGVLVYVPLAAFLNRRLLRELIQLLRPSGTRDRGLT